MGDNDRAEDLRSFFLEDYKQSREDWRYLDSFIWQIPSVCVVIVGALLGIAYYAIDDLGVRLLLIIASVMFTFCLTFTMFRHNEMQLGVQGRIELLTEMMTSMEFTRKKRQSSYSALALAMVVLFVLLMGLLLSVAVDLCAS